MKGLVRFSGNCRWCGWWLAVLALSPVALGQTLPRNHRATIHPSVVNLEPGQEQRFKVVMIATRLMGADVPKEVKWSVNEISGGNATLGTIDTSGVYKAPAAIPTPREIHICAEAPEAANRYLRATVIMGDSPPRYKSLGTWSEPVVKGTESTDHLTDPHGIGLDKDGNLLIADQFGNKVHRYTPDGKYLGELGKGKGSEEGYFTEPRQVLSDTEGRIFVTDSKGDRPRIQVFSPKGEFLQIFAEKGMKPSMILRAHGMDIDPAGRLYTVDVDNMRVNVYSPAGEFLYAWGTEGLNPGQFNSPHGIFVDRNADVFVSGYYGPTQKFNSEGDFITAFCHGDPPDGPVYFHSCTGDRWGNVYVTVRTKEGYEGALQYGSGKKISIAKYNNNGDFITSWGFSAPEHRESAAVVDKEGRVYA
ncbi:MAG: NHL repeat-containing protein, partial [Candidatus Hydrogenedentes bacterium]|nr:NHL repeat-containing protein [Candidatus Hydrogenedentota bacterium]